MPLQASGSGDRGFGGQDPSRLDVGTKGVLVYTLSENSSPEMIVRRQAQLLNLISIDSVVLINFSRDVQIETSYVALLITVVRRLRSLGRWSSLALCVPNDRVWATLESCRLTGQGPRRSKLFRHVYAGVDEAIEDLYEGRQPPYVLHLNATTAHVRARLGASFGPKNATDLLAMLAGYGVRADVPVDLPDPDAEAWRVGRVMRQAIEGGQTATFGATFEIASPQGAGRRIVLRPGW